MSHLPYNKNLKAFSRELRNNSTVGEVALWKKLRGRAMMGYQFNRQKPLGNYIVDFYCKALGLVIEIDGGYHTSEEQTIADEERQKMLEVLSLNFLRFYEQEVRQNIQAVLSAIENFILEYERLHPDVKTPL